jgi:hypothetical protein
MSSTAVHQGFCHICAAVRSTTTQSFEGRHFASTSEWADVFGDAIAKSTRRRAAARCIVKICVARDQIVQFPRKHMLARASA